MIDDDKPTGNGPPPESPPTEAESGTLNFVTDAVRKAVLTGLGAVFLTEEGARRLAREWKLPKEIVGYVVSQASGAKDEVVRVVNDEVRRFFESDALRREFLRVLSSMTVEIHAEIRLKPSKHGDLAIPEVKITSRPRVRRARDEDKDE